ncbi:MAG: HEPN domain-containing protein [Desulfobacterales bacterium]|jgi:HEPN domain-containing protein|nr:HEPN domain-containing protein [Desulfobacterales bacterium]
MHKKDLITYWLKSSDRDFQAMIHLLEKGDYTWSLFIGHLVLEKLLKAWYVQHIDNTPPFIHDLVRLAEKSALPLDESKKDLLDSISTFNIRARYDDYKMEFYKKCSKDFTEKWIEIIKELRAWLKENLLKQQ